MIRQLFAAASVTAVTLSTAAANAEEPLKIGFMATLEGTYTVLGEDGLRGFKVALDEIENTAGGRPIEVIIGATDASPDSAVRAARKLVEQRTRSTSSSARCRARRGSPSATTPRRIRR